MRIWLALVGAGALAACAVATMPEPPEGAALFAENCALCHGPAGRGDGDIAAGLRPKPADLTRLAAKNRGTFPTARVLSQIDGYTRMQKGGQEMPEFGLLLEGDTVPVLLEDGKTSPVPRPLAALVVYLQSIQR